MSAAGRFDAGLCGGSRWAVGGVIGRRWRARKEQAGFRVLFCEVFFAEEQEAGDVVEGDVVEVCKEDQDSMSKRWMRWKGGRASKPVNPVKGDVWRSYGSCFFISKGCPVRGKKDFLYNGAAWEEQAVTFVGWPHSGHPEDDGASQEPAPADVERMKTMISLGRTSAEIIAFFQEAAHCAGKVNLAAFVPTKAQVKRQVDAKREERGEVTDQLNRMDCVTDVAIKRSGVPCVSVIVKSETHLAGVLKRIKGDSILFLDGTSGIGPRGTQVVVAMMRVDSGEDVPIAYQVTSGHAEADYAALLASLVKSGVSPTFVTT